MANSVSKSLDVDFNDSVLGLQGWSGPRTEGVKLTGKFINYYNEGDITYGKNPVIENKVAAVYLGNTIIGGDDEDASRVSISGHSYVSIDRVLIIDIDTDEVEIIDRINLPAVAFRRMVQRDLPEFSRVNVKLLDFSTQNNVKPQHYVKFNQGSLMRIYDYQANTKGHEDGVFGGFGLRENKQDPNNQAVEYYGSSSVGYTDVHKGCFSYGMTACVSHSLFVESPEILSSSIDVTAGITMSIVVQEYHPSPYSFIPKFPSELTRYEGDVTLSTLGNELSICSASINPTFNVGVAIQLEADANANAVLTGPAGPSGPPPGGSGPATPWGGGNFVSN
tara:strand:- start:778 stop:1782 length:1005 start_codon:yes stop_codon:yes gene_type:complete